MTRLRQQLEYIRSLRDEEIFGARFDKIETHDLHFETKDGKDTMFVSIITAKQLDPVSKKTSEKALGIFFTKTGELELLVCDSVGDVDLFNASQVFDLFYETGESTIRDFLKKGKLYLDKENTSTWKNLFFN